MVTLPDAVVGSAATSDRGWEVLEGLVEIGNRMPGSEGEAEGARALARQFEGIGLDGVDVTGFEIPGWSRGPASISVRERTFDAPHRIVGLPGSPAAEVEAGLVDLGYALPPDFEAADVEGKVVLATASAGDPEGYDRPLHRTEKYARAVDAGAAGFLFWSGLEGGLPPTGWVRLERPDALPGEIPAAGVSKELGERLVRYCRAGPTSVDLSVDAESAPATSHNVEATVGPDTDEEVLVTAHVDAHDLGEGARDNATGCALVCEVGRLLSRMEGEPGTRVRLVCFGSEEMGFAGAHHWAGTHDLDRVRCILNLDGIGGSRDLHVRAHGSDALEGIFREVADGFGVPVKIDPGVNPFADQWAFVSRGVPGAQLRSVPADSDRRWGLGRLWSHTHGDTLDKLDRRDLRDLAVLATAGTVAAAEAGREIPRRSTGEVRESVPEAVEAEMRTTGRWPW